MGHGKVSEKYPCGYEYEMEVDGLWMDLVFESHEKCPLHGKECKAPRG